MASDNHNDSSRANQSNLVLEVWRGDTLVRSSEFSESSVTLGSGQSAMLRVDSGALAELHAVVNVEEDGSVLVLDLVGNGGITVGGRPVPNAQLRPGDSFGIGDLTFRVRRGGGAPAPAYSAPASSPAPVSAPMGMAASDHHDDHHADEPDVADAVAFSLRQSVREPAQGEKRRAPVLEVHQIWGNVVLDVKMFPMIAAGANASGSESAREVSIGARTGHRWSFLGVDMGWVPSGVGAVLPFFAPMWSEVSPDLQSDFLVPREALPGERDWTLFTPGSDGSYSANIAPGWSGFADIGGKQIPFDELARQGKATATGGGYTIPVEDNVRLVIEAGTSVFIAQRSIPGLQAVARGGEDVDYAFFGMIGFGALIFTTIALLMFLRPPGHSDDANQLDDRLVDLLLDKPEPEKKDKKKDANPDAGEGAKAKKEEGKVGKKEAKIEKTKGNKIEVKKLEIDRQIAENAGVLGAMNDSDLNQVLGASGLSNSLTQGIGGLIGTNGTQIGSGGLGSRGGGLGGGGSAEGLGGLGTKGLGSGASGYGKGGGDFGAKGEGGIGTVGGDPIILGALDRSLIDEVIKRSMNQIKYCYQRELTKNPALGGKIVIKFTIAKDGTVSQASTKSTTMGNAAVENCIVGRFMRMQFPQPKGGGIVIVSYPFLFSPS